MPRAKLKPTEAERLRVKSLAAYGIRTDEIARYIGVSEKTLLKYYKDEIFRGRFEANAKVGKALLEMSCDGETVAASIYWTKARCGWNEKQVAEAPAAVPDFVVALEKKAA